MKPLIDADILLYEVGFSSQTEEGGFIVPRSWQHCEELLEHKIKLICEEAGATQPPTLFLTNTPFINNYLNKRRRMNDEPEVAYLPNFREAAATSKTYKDGRKQVKPIHFYNIIVYLFSKYDVHVNEKALEADDAMCIAQMSALSIGQSTVICSRDKDVRQVGGWHYSWECGKQAAIGPVFIHQPGWIELIRKKNDKGKNLPPKVFGYGNKFFYAQLLMGDGVDNVGGAKSIGPVGAFKLLNKLTSSEEMLEKTCEAYREIYKESWREKLEEAGQLVWMVREVDEKGDGVKWNSLN